MVKLTVVSDQDRLVAKAVELFTSRWQARTRVRLLAKCAKPTWELVIETGRAGQPQSYAITTAGRKLTVSGTDGRGVLYGLGHLLRQLVFAPDRVVLPVINETRTPAVYNRGVYFATHFNNWYEAAPIEQVERYIEEMALWGFDAWMFWFDMNWFPHGFWRDPESRGMQMIGRLRRMIATARACGMKVASGGLGNEGFNYQPPAALRADPSGRHGGFYQFSQICPSQPGGLKMILENRRQVMQLLGEYDVHIHWPYDQGGCGCAQCAHAPGRWGKKFLEIGEKITAVAREVNPEVQVVVSTWLMDEVERKMVYAQCDANAAWFQGILSHADHMSEYTPPAQYSRAVFPEISMFDCYFCSYGSNGANPAPQRMAAEAQRVARAGWGTELYSEGMYTDLNVAVYAGRLWDPSRDAIEILTEYTRYYFGQANVKAGTELICGLETTWGAQALLKSNAKTVTGLLAKARSLKARLPRHRDAVDRWRLLLDRAEMDQLMKVVGPDRPLAIESREIFEAICYAPAAKLRSRVKQFTTALRRRQKLVNQLMDVHWRYLQHFAIEKNVLAFLPDDVIGRHQWNSLIEPLAKAVTVRDEARMRNELSRAFKRWFWCNGIDANYLFQ